MNFNNPINHYCLYHHQLYVFILIDCRTETVATRNETIGAHKKTWYENDNLDF